MSITNSLRYCGDVEYKYNRGYGWARIGRYGLPIPVCTGMTAVKLKQIHVMMEYFVMNDTMHGYEVLYSCKLKFGV